MHSDSSCKTIQRRATVAGNCLRKMFRLNWEVCLLQSGLLRTTTPSSKTLRAQHHLCVKLLPALRNLKMYSRNSNWMFVEAYLRWTGTRHAADSLSLAASAAPPYNWGILPFCMVAQIHKFVLLVLSCQNHLEVWQDRLVARLQLEHRLPTSCLMFWLSQSVN